MPRSGTVRGGWPLAETGDCRPRFPTPESGAGLADVAPSTRQSGQVKHVGYRWAADKQRRDAVCDFAGDRRRANLWATDLYNRTQAIGHPSDPPQPRTTNGTLTQGYSWVSLPVRGGGPFRWQLSTCSGAGVVARSCFLCGCLSRRTWSV
uniref:transposase n=1 Tax=Candidatus Mycobacterium methanotrophicum TaxID=2943498 RepID=UPI002714DFB5|nr:transposase [Candidatus Mycobacterium methanotrophicum]